LINNFIIESNLEKEESKCSNPYGENREISPYRDGENSFFSDAANISNINYVTNQTDMNIDNFVGGEVNDLKKEKDPNQRLLKLTNLKSLMASEKQKEMTLSEDQSEISSQNMQRVRFKLYFALF